MPKDRIQKSLNITSNKSVMEKKASDRLQLKFKIKKIEGKNGYGIVLICIVAGLILMSTLLGGFLFTFSIPAVAINTLLIGIHIILILLFKKEKLLVYSGGLIAYWIAVALNTVLAEWFFFGRLYIFFVISGSYIIFIYEEFKLRALKSKLSQLE